MRKLFVKELMYHMYQNDDIYLLTADVGFNVLEPIRDSFPQRFFNVGASESAMVDIGIGLALSGKIPFCYTITPFLLRAWEQIRTYINYENLNVKLVGTGRHYLINDGVYKSVPINERELDDYGDVMGYTHSADKILDMFYTLDNFWVAEPDMTEVPVLVDRAVHTTKPFYINLTR